MSARSVGIGAMFGWVGETFGLVKRNYGALSAASLLTICASLLFAAPMFYLMFKSIASGLAPTPDNPLGMDMKLFFTLYAAMIVAGLLLFPPLMGGWFRLCENADRGASARGTDIFGPYRELPTWMRLVGFALLAMLMYLVVMALVGLAFGGIIGKLMAMQAAQNAAMFSGQPPPPPDLGAIGGIFLMYIIVLPVMFLLQFVYMVGMAEVSLRSTPVLVAFKDAFAAVLRNSLKLLVLLFCLGVAAGIVFAVIGLVLALVIGVLAMISQTAMVVVLVLLYIPLLMVMYPLMFAGHYMVWKSMLGSEPPMAPDSAASVAA